MLFTKGLSFHYNGSRHFSFPDIQLSAGKDLLVLGKSGIGKTTLLHLICGILKPTDGSILIDDQRLSDLKTSALDKFRGSNVGLIFQKPYFIASLSLKENLEMVQFLSGKQKEQSAIHEVLDRLDMSGEVLKRPSELSQGQQQRATIAMAVLNRPKLILADEPTSSLDDENCDRVIQLLKDQAHDLNAALVVITHDHRLKNVFHETLTL